MATKKALSNKQNAQKSTGPKTTRGKAVASQNAVQHGLLSRSLVLPSEDPQEFTALLQQLQSELAPAGTLEQTMVERIAIALWRQRRLVAAESGQLILRQSLMKISERHQVRSMAGLKAQDDDWIDLIAKDPPSRPELLAELDALDQAVISGSNAADQLQSLEQQCPMSWTSLCDEAEALGDLTAAQRLIQLITHLRDTETTVQGWLDSQIYEQRKMLRLLDALATVRQAAGLPENADVLARYQSALDNDVYKATRALREQQRFRLEHAALNATALPADSNSAPQRLAP
jgi:hypothetical protein